MYFIEVIDPDDLHEGYIALSVDKVKLIIISILKDFQGEDDEWEPDQPKGWCSIIEEVGAASSFEEIDGVVSKLACGTDVTFRFSTIEEGAPLELMD